MHSQKLIQGKKDALDKAQQYFKYANNHPSMTKYRREAKENYGFYDGTGQWEESVKQQLIARGQTPIVVNKIKNLVNYMAGMEIQTRVRIGFRSHSGKEEDNHLAKALTHLGYAIQENNNISYKGSLKFRDTLITGIGWSNIYRDPQNGVIKYEYVDPMDILYDPDDLTPTLEDMTFVIRIRWMPVHKAKGLWPKHKKYFEEIFDDDVDKGDISGELEQRRQESIDMYTKGDGSHGSRVMIVEVQYKETKKSYCGMDSQGHSFQTFNKEEAEALISSQAQQNEQEEMQKAQELKEEEATQIMRVMYTGDELLEYAPLDPQLPNLADFTYIPSVWTRRHEDGVPVGWIDVMKDIQRESNYRRSKLITNLNSFRATVDAGALGAGKSIESLREEIKRPDSVILKSGTGDIKVESNQPLANGQFEMQTRSDAELQQVSGIFDEALGKETNAQSGVAIKYRQVNSVRNQQFAFDNLRMTKKREAIMMLALIQGGGDEFLESHILTDDEKKVVLLNVVREINGQKIVLNDIRTLPLSIYVEEVPDYESMSQEQSQELEAVLNNPHAQLILQSPALMKRMGIRDYKEVAEEMKQIMQEQAQQEQGNAPQQGSDQLPTEGGDGR